MVKAKTLKKSKFPSHFTLNWQNISFSEKFLEIFCEQKKKKSYKVIDNQSNNKNVQVNITVKVLSFTSAQPLLKYSSQVKAGTLTLFSLQYQNFKQQIC